MDKQKTPAWRAKSEEIPNLITQKSGDDYINDLTREMDKYIIFQPKYGSTTYIYGNDINKNRMAIRFPGATRGGIELDENRVITSIYLYGATCFGKSI